ncbi:MAG: (2Fe-2S)-binding protein [bacterium]
MNAPTSVTIRVDGRSLRVAEGTTVAAALLNDGWLEFRRSVSGESRTPLCGMGICHECRVIINDVEHQRACLVTVSEGLRVTTSAATP